MIETEGLGWLSRGFSNGRATAILRRLKIEKPGKGRQEAIYQVANKRNIDRNQRLVLS